MKTVVLSVVLLVLTVQLAVAQDAFSRFSLETNDYCTGPPGDPYRNCQCWIDLRTGPVTVYAVHRILQSPAYDIAKIRFRVVADPELNWTYVGETIPVDGGGIQGYTGNTQDGIEVDCAYSGGNRLVAVIEYVATEVPGECAGLRVGPHPEATTPSVEFQGSDGVWRAPTFIYDLGTYNGDEGPWCLVPTKNDTWGAIKALYR